MSSLLGHCHGENWKSPTRSFGRSGKAKRTFRETKKNVFVKPNEQHRACSNVAMTIIENRQHRALDQVERQNALFEEREKAINRRYSRRYKWACSGTTKGLYKHYKHLVA